MKIIYYKMCKKSLCDSLVDPCFIPEILKTLKLVKYQRDVLHEISELF
jgi:hypothetical protein